ncbi:hypothetical protein K439DRAFT_115766 [Ramaria rubella]|nr:hypothetical protein K439DRAFT_115766 [Ramaria rubella]
MFLRYWKIMFPWFRAFMAICMAYLFLEVTWGADFTRLAHSIRRSMNGWLQYAQ